MMSSGPVSWDSDCPSELSGSGSASGCDSDHDASSHSLPSSLDDAVVSAGSTESTGLAFLHTQSTLSVTHKDVHAFAAQLPPGSVIAHRFEVLERIGEGSFGAAYRALDIAHGRMLVRCMCVHVWLCAGADDAAGAHAADATCAVQHRTPTWYT